MALHLLPFIVLTSALPLTPREIGGGFGQPVSITLVSGAPASSPAAAEPEVKANLEGIERRLSQETVETPRTSSPSTSTNTTRLSDLFREEMGAGGQAGASGRSNGPSTGEDDPFTRAAVSYRGDDPAKAASLAAKARRCVQEAKGMRLLVIINSQGQLMARPRPLGSVATDKRVQKAVSALERCAPFTDAASPGAPRSYEVDLG